MCDAWERQGPGQRRLARFWRVDPGPGPYGGGRFRPRFSPSGALRCAQAVPIRYQAQGRETLLRVRTVLGRGWLRSVAAVSLAVALVAPLGALAVLL